MSLLSRIENISVIGVNLSLIVGMLCSSYVLYQSGKQIESIRKSRELFLMSTTEFIPYELQECRCDKDDKDKKDEKENDLTESPKPSSRDLEL